MTQSNIDLGKSIPEAPGLLEAKDVIKSSLDSNPDQAAALLTSLGAIKKARTDSYEAYLDLCDELGVPPVSKESWGQHDRESVHAMTKPLVIAAVKRAIPQLALEEADIDALISASAGAKSKREVASAIINIIMKVTMQVPDEKVAAYARLAKSAASLI